MAEIIIAYQGDFATRCVHQETGQVILTDAPKEAQGLGRTFSPTDLLVTALGSCVLTLMGMAAKKLNITISGSSLVAHKEMSKTPPRRIAKIRMTIFCPHRFDLATTQQLEEAARKCPVHESLHPDTIQEFIFKWGENS